jgi:hypothetical protein
MIDIWRIAKYNTSKYIVNWEYKNTEVEAEITMFQKCLEIYESRILGKVGKIENSRIYRANNHRNITQRFN